MSPLEGNMKRGGVIVLRKKFFSSYFLHCTEQTTHTQTDWLSFFPSPQSSKQNNADRATRWHRENLPETLREFRRWQKSKTKKTIKQEWTWQRTRLPQTEKNNNGKKQAKAIACARPAKRLLINWAAQPVPCWLITTTATPMTRTARHSEDDISHDGLI